jgi:hypothetical protein
MSLLTICQAVADRVGITRPATVVTSTDLQVRQLYALANEEGMELSKRYNWQALSSEWTFITTATEEQTNAPIPPDLARFVPDSFFNRTTRRKLTGPLTPQEWQAIQAFPIYVTPYISFRERQGAFIVAPVPPAGQTIAYEYISSNWALSNASVGRTQFMADDDTSYLDEQLIIQGVRWRYKQAQGLDYSEEMATYERNVSRAGGADGGARKISMSAPTFPPILGINVPDGSYGL